MTEKVIVADAPVLAVADDPNVFVGGKVGEI